MEKKKFDFRQANYNKIGNIYTKINTFFANVTNGLNEANLALYEQQFTSIMNEAHNVMDADHFPTFNESNTKRWNRIKQPFLASKTPVQATATQEQCNYIQEEKSAENRPKTSLGEANAEIQRLKQIIENKDIIIQSLLKINKLQSN